MTESSAALIVDLASANRFVSDDDFRQWAKSQTVFLSSVMSELTAERQAVAAALGEAGFTVRWFEAFGGRDDSADAAYLSEVAASDIYIGLLADRYGAVQKTGFSATHEEFQEARRRGKRVTFWVRADEADRDGHARRFVDEVRVFNVTGTYTSGHDLVAGLLGRLREMASEDLCPWVKVANVVFRAETIVDEGETLQIDGLLRDRSVAAELRALGSKSDWDIAGPEVPVTFGELSGVGQITALSFETSASASQRMRATMKVRWPQRPSVMTVMGINGLPHHDVVEAELRASLLGEALPSELSGRSWGALSIAATRLQRCPH